MGSRLKITNLTLAVLLVMLLSWLFKVEIVDEMGRQRRQLQAQADQIKVLTAGLESLLKIVAK